MDTPIFNNNDMDEILNDFITETEEVLTNLDSDLISLEKKTDDSALINNIFRAVHTIKGAAGFLGFTQMVELLHQTESLLNKLRQGEITVTPQINDVILHATDVIKILLNDIKENNKTQRDTKTILAELAQWVSEEKEKGKESENTEKENVNNTPPPDIKLGEILVNNNILSSEQLEEALEEQVTPKIGEVLIKKKYATKEEIEGALSAQPDKKTVKEIEQSIRVNVSRLDNVMNLVGELVLGRNRLLKLGLLLAEKYEDEKLIKSLNETASHVNIVSSDLQMAVMKTRMQPIRKVFIKFPRMVRDIARNQKKEVDFIVSGEETELDRSVIEIINDPLVHLIRNGLDHGLEPPAVRTAAGKPSRGLLELSAYYEGDNIIIEIRDDGSGINAERVREKAIEKGMINRNDSEQLSKKEIFNFIFSPGFTTAKELSDLSGRGVGMDVVKTNIAKLNGLIDIDSEEGKGTMIRIKLPLTVAIIQALMVGIGSEVFAIPLGSVIEIIRIKRSDINRVRGKEVITLRDRVLSLVRLGDIFRIQSNGKSSKWLYVVIIGLAEKKIGIIVEKLFSQEEVVIKSIGEYVHTKGIAGATILGSGKVTLIIDIAQFMELINETLLHQDSFV